MPERAWKQKRERQYEHIKERERRRGRSEQRAERIAAATVNETRRRKGEIKDSRNATGGTGNPNASLESRSKKELYNRAKELDIARRSEMTKQQLVQAIRKRS